MPIGLFCDSQAKQKLRYGENEQDGDRPEQEAVRLEKLRAEIADFGERAGLLDRDFRLQFRMNFLEFHGMPLWSKGFSYKETIGLYDL